MKHPALILRHAAQVVARLAVLGGATVRAVACGRKLLDVGLASPAETKSEFYFPFFIF